MCLANPKQGEIHHMLTTIPLTAPTNPYPCTISLAFCRFFYAYA